MSNVKSRLRHPVLFVLFLVLCLLSIIPAAIGASTSRGLLAKPDDLNQLTAETAYEGQIVSGQIFGSLGSFGQVYKTDDNGNIIGEDELIFYYLLPINNDYSIAIATDDKELVSTLDVLTAATTMYRNGETDSIEHASFDYSGMLIALNDDELTHMYTWILQTGTFGASTVEEASANIIPYKIMSFNKNGGLPLMIFGCAAFVVFAVFMLRFLKMRVLVDENGDIIEEKENTGADGKK